MGAPASSCLCVPFDGIRCVGRWLSKSQSVGRWRCPAPLTDAGWYSVRKRLTYLYCRYPQTCAPFYTSPKYKNQENIVCNLVVNPAQSSVRKTPNSALVYRGVGGTSLHMKLSEPSSKTICLKRGHKVMVWQLPVRMAVAVWNARLGPESPSPKHSSSRADNSCTAGAGFAVLGELLGRNG